MSVLELITIKAFMCLDAGFLIKKKLISIYAQTL